MTMQNNETNDTKTTPSFPSNIKLEKFKGQMYATFESDGVKYAYRPILGSNTTPHSMSQGKIHRSLKGFGPATLDELSMDEVHTKSIVENYEIAVLETFAKHAEEAIIKNLDTLPLLKETKENTLSFITKMYTGPLPDSNDKLLQRWVRYEILDRWTDISQDLLQLYKASEQAIPDSDFHTSLLDTMDQILKAAVSFEQGDLDQESMDAAYLSVRNKFLEALKGSAATLNSDLFQEAIKEIDVLATQQRYLKDLDSITTYKVGETSEEEETPATEQDYRARAHNDAHKMISELVEEGFKGRELGDENQRVRYSILDTQFSLSNFLGAALAEADFRVRFGENQPHFDAYKAAFAEAFTRYYQELHKHMKSHSSVSEQDGRTYYSVSRPKDGCVRVKHEFEFSFEKNPQKENVAVIDREIKEMVSAYQTAFFILESMNSNNDLAEKRYKDLRVKFEGDIGRLLNERAACINTLSDELKKEIPQAPTYHVIVSDQRVLEVRADAKDEESPVREKDLKWEEGYLKKILSLQTILNCLRMLTRVFQRYVSAMTSPHHRQMNRKNAEVNRNQVKINNTIMRFSPPTLTSDAEHTVGADKPQSESTRSRTNSQ